MEASAALGRVLNVLMISQYYRPEPIGSGPVCADLAEAFAGAGQNVRVLTARPHYPGHAVYPSYRDGALDRQLINDVGVTRVATYLRAGGSTVNRLMNESSFAISGGSALLRDRSAPADIVVALCPSIFTVLLASAQSRRGTRCVALVHDIQSGIAEGLGMAGGKTIGALRRLERVAFNRCDLLVVLSDEMGQKLRRMGVTRPICVHPIWIDTDRIEATEPPAGPARVALYSGNFGRKQGLGQLIAAAAELARRNAGITVRLRGNGGERPRLEHEVRTAGLRNVDICDLLPADLLSTALADGDIHLVPQEPSTADYAVPSKIYGIMAAARPFVATARPGSTLWRLQEETDAFRCVPPDDPVALADAVMALSADGELRRALGRRGRAYVEENCAKDASLRRLTETIAGTACDRR